jgi:hypothetical protein
VDGGVGVCEVEGGDGVGVAGEEVGARAGVGEAEWGDDGFSKGVDEFVGDYGGGDVDGCGGGGSIG